MVNGARPSHVRWFLICWLFILSAVSYLDRVNISIAGRSIAEDYGLSNVQLGYVFSAMLIGYALFQTVGGRLADRFGPRRVSDCGSCMVGNLHRTDGPGAIHNPRGAVPVYRYSLSHWVRGRQWSIPRRTNLWRDGFQRTNAALPTAGSSPGSARAQACHHR